MGGSGSRPIDGKEDTYGKERDDMTATKWFGGGEWDPFYRTHWYFIKAVDKNSAAAAAAAAAANLPPATSSFSSAPKAPSAAAASASAAASSSSSAFAGVEVVFTEGSDMMFDRIPRKSAHLPIVRFDPVGGFPGRDPALVEGAACVYALTAVNKNTGTLTADITEAVTDYEPKHVPQKGEKVRDAASHALRLALCTIDNGSGGSKAKVALAYEITRGKTENTMHLTHPVTGTVYHFSTTAPAPTTKTTAAAA